MNKPQETVPPKGEDKGYVPADPKAYAAEQSRRWSEDEGADTHRSKPVAAAAS